MQQQSAGVRYGLIGGLIGSIFLLLIFFIDHTLIFKPIVYLRPVILIGFMVLAALELKKQDRTDFKFILRQTFLVAIIANFFAFFCNHLIYNVLDPNLAQIATEYAVDMMNNNSGVLNPDMLEQAIDQIENYDSTITLKKTISSYSMSLILSFIPALIISAIYSNRKA